MKMLIPDNIAKLTEAQLLRAFLDIYEADNLKDALQQWAAYLIFEGYDIEGGVGE